MASREPLLVRRMAQFPNGPPFCRPNLTASSIWSREETKEKKKVYKQPVVINIYFPCLLNHGL